MAGRGEPILRLDCVATPRQGSMSIQHGLLVVTRLRAHA